MIGVVCKEGAADRRVKWVYLRQILMDSSPINVKEHQVSCAESESISEKKKV